MRAALRGPAAEAMHLQPFLDDLPDRKPRRQARERVLEHDLQLAPERPDRRRRQALELAPVMPYLLLVLVLIFRPTGLMGRRES